MAEVKDSVLYTHKIAYTDVQMRSFALRGSRLQPIEPGDRCCACGLDCDQEGFAAFYNFIAFRVYGHPFCSRPKCHGQMWDEFNGRRSGCGCGKRKVR